jgi:HlyD family secretion protein
MTLSLPERAVIVRTGIINDTFVEILSGLEEGQLIELAGTAASSSNLHQGEMMFFTGPGPGAAGRVPGSGGSGQVMITRP